MRDVGPVVKDARSHRTAVSGESITRKLNFAIPSPSYKSGFWCRTVCRLPFSQTRHDTVPSSSPARESIKSNSPKDNARPLTMRMGMPKTPLTPSLKEQTPLRYNVASKVEGEG